MFLICSFEDVVRIIPSELGSETVDAVTAVLEKAYVDRIVKDAGLVVTVYEIQSIEGGFIYHSDGAVHFNVKFSLVIFRPLLGELIDGEIKRSTKEGIWVSLCFFEDVFVPAYSLQQPSEYDEKQQVWFWDWEGTPMYMDPGSEVRLRVKDVKFKTVPTPAQLKLKGEELLGTAAQPFVPMEVVGSMDQDGLGCIEWWTPTEDDGMDE